jgi:sarcosine oxidase delta subunit
MELQNIKPCLFCGKEQNTDSFHYNGDGPPPSYSVECEHCGARGPSELGAFRGDHEGARRKAAEAWNRAHAVAERLRAAIFKHRSQKADDRCIEDDDELYAALGDGIKCDRRVGDKLAMLTNCARFIERRCEGGGWPSYADLESEIERLRANAQGG